MNILVFGKNGQLGNALQSVFSPQKFGELHRLYFADRAQCDVSNTKAVSNLLQETKPQLIINAAAYTAVDEAEKEIDLAYSVNADAPAIMAQFAAREGATLLHYSTDYVFDGTKATPYLESDARNPLGIYGKSKAAGEEAIENAFKQNLNTEARFAILRTSWVYGNGDNFIRTILRFAKEGDSLKVIANQYGVPTSAFWLANMSSILALNESDQLQSFPSGIYHAIPQGKTTWHGVASYALQVALDTGAELKLRPEQVIAISASEYPLPAPRPMNSSMARSALDALMNQILTKTGDVTQLQRWQQAWQEPVANYVKDLVLHKRI
jgi:dTDP-4-dehydrorhamnose reductase